MPPSGKKLLPAYAEFDGEAFCGELHRVRSTADLDTGRVPFTLAGAVRGIGSTGSHLYYSCKSIGRRIVDANSLFGLSCRDGQTRRQ